VAHGDRDFPLQCTVSGRARPGRAAVIPATAAPDRVFAVQYERTVAADNTVALGKKRFQLGPVAFAVTLSGAASLVHEHLDETFSITYGRM